MVGPRKRRIVRRGALLVALFVWLPIVYVSTWGGYCFAYGAGWLPEWTDAPARVLWSPIGKYRRSGWPGAATLNLVADCARREGVRNSDD